MECETQGKILKVARAKQDFVYSGKSIRMTVEEGKWNVKGGRFSILYMNYEIIKMIVTSVSCDTLSQWSASRGLRAP